MPTTPPTGTTLLRSGGGRGRQDERKRMKIKVNQEIDVPDKMICHYGRSQCVGLCEGANLREGFNLCANFNRVVRWSDKAGFYVRHEECIQAHMDYLYGVTK
jgi:hypothetical protein